MKSKYRIAIVGTGGVGGYLGALLSDAQLGPDAEVVFVSRGENLQAIKLHGIKLVTDDGERICRPDVITNGSTPVGGIDLLLCCVKNFDLEESLKTLAPSIHDETMILPLLNGINATERIKALYPKAKVLKGAIYLVSRLISPGVIKQSGPLNQLYFGSDEVSFAELESVKIIFDKAGIKADIAPDMDFTLWEKFFFISAMATITSYYNCGIGEIQTDPIRMAHLQGLLAELEQIAVKSRIEITSDLNEKTLAKIKGLPPTTTSSMLNDFRKGGKTEIDDLTGCVVALGKKLQLATPTYDMMYTDLKYKEYGVR